MRKRWFLGIVMGILFALAGVGGARASVTEPSAPVLPEDANYICSTRIQLRYPSRCAAIGPAGQLEKYARLGVYPSEPLPATPLDDALSAIPYYYLRVERNEIFVFPDLNSALKGKGQSRVLGKGTLYLSWTHRFVEGRQVVYQIGPGAYVRGDHVTRIGTPNFLGLTFEKTPKNAFGWVMTTVNSRIAPGYDQSETEKTYYRFQVVQIYDTKQVGDYAWYMVGLGEWIEQRMIAMVQPQSEPPQGVESNDWVSINLFEQTLAAYEDGEMVFATAISSGLRGWWTRPGVFQVYKKYESDDMQGAFEADRSDFYYLEDVPWVLYYDEARALHGTYWHNNYGYAQSHGCVNLSPADAQWIFDWAEEGTWVHVYDPSGETPTDPELYGEGGV